MFLSRLSQPRSGGTMGTGSRTGEARSWSPCRRTSKRRPMDLNARGLRVVEALRGRLDERRVSEHAIEGGGRYLDFGIEARGGLLAGLDLARVCLADLGEVAIIPGEVGGRPCPTVQVVTDHPVVACLGSQYAGWAIAE